MQRLSEPGWAAWGALAVTIFIWSAFLVVTRAAMTSALGPIEVGLIRYGVGGLFFLPVIWRAGVVPRGAGLREFLLIPLCGGVLFILLLSTGLGIAPVADSGVFTPSMLPVYTAALAFLFLGERFTGLRLAGFALIILGALSVGGWEALSRGEAGLWRGHLLFTAASITWAVYTIGFRLSGLAASEAGAMLAVWSALAFGVFALAFGADFSRIGPGALAVQILFQGVLSGFVATYTYFYAVAHLGASRTAAFAALVPVLAALGGWLFLGEPIGPLKGLGILVVSGGVALASGAFPLRKRRLKDVADDA